MRIASFQGSSRSCVVTVLAVIVLYEAILARERIVSAAGSRPQERTRASLPGFIKWPSAFGKKRNIRATQSVSPVPYGGFTTAMPLWFLVSPPPCPRMLVLSFSPHLAGASFNCQSLVLSSLLSLSFFSPARCIVQNKLYSVALKMTMQPRGRARERFGCTSIVWKDQAILCHLVAIVSIDW